MEATAIDWLRRGAPHRLSRRFALGAKEKTLRALLTLMIGRLLALLYGCRLQGGEFEELRAFGDFVRISLVARGMGLCRGYRVSSILTSG